jgi:hypothetical protein
MIPREPPRERPALVQIQNTAVDIVCHRLCGDQPRAEAPVLRRRENAPPEPMEPDREELVGVVTRWLDVESKNVTSEINPDHLRRFGRGSQDRASRPRGYQASETEAEAEAEVKIDRKAAGGASGGHGSAPWLSVSAECRVDLETMYRGQWIVPPFPLAVNPQWPAGSVFAVEDRDPHI